MVQNEAVTGWCEAENKLGSLEKLPIHLPANQVLVGFKLERDGSKVRYKYWYAEHTAPGNVIVTFTDALDSSSDWIDGYDQNDAKHLLQSVKAQESRMVTGFGIKKVGGTATKYVFESTTRALPSMRLVVRDTGNVVVLDHAGLEIWSTSSKGDLIIPDTLPFDRDFFSNGVLQSQNGKYNARLEGNGHFLVSAVLQPTSYAIGETVLLNPGFAPFSASLTKDGNLIIRDSTRTCVWQTATSNHANGPHRLTLLNDGSLSVYDSRNTAIWTLPMTGKLHYLPSTSTLKEGQYLCSPNNLFFLFLKSDGNLVVTQSADCANPQVPILWQSGSAGKGVGPYSMTMQWDDNLVIYDSKGTPTWASNTGHSYSSRWNLFIENNGSLRVGDHNGSSGWSTNAITSNANGYRAFPDSLTDLREVPEGCCLQSANGFYVARMLSDGNVAVATNDNFSTAFLWSSGTKGHGVGPFKMRLHSNGNLMVLDGTGAIIFTTNVQKKGAKGPFRLTMQDNGILAIFDSYGVPYWQSTLATIDILSTDCMISDGEYLCSSNNSSYLYLQSDGILCVTKSLDSSVDMSSRAKWRSHTNQKGTGPFRLTMQSDGNLVIYDATNSPVWASGSNNSNKGSYRLKLNDDGSLRIFKPDGTNIWTTSACVDNSPSDSLVGLHDLRQNEYIRAASGRYFLRMHQDGNLVVFSCDDWLEDHVLWSTNITDPGRGPFYCRCHEDGRVAIYNGSNKLIWGVVESVKAKGPFRLTVQDSGKLTIRDSLQREYWEQSFSWNVHDNLSMNSKLTQGNYLASPNNLFFLFLQPNSGAVITQSLDFTNITSVPTLWQSGINKSLADCLVMQGDGNLVIYDNKYSPLWASNTYAGGIQYGRVVLENNGQLCVYYGGSRRWSSPVPISGVKNAADSLTNSREFHEGQYLESYNGSYFARLQSDGNLVITNSSNWATAQILWSTDIQVELPGPYHCKIDESGNLAIYGKQNELVWQTNTKQSCANGPYRLTMQNNGKLGIFSSSNSNVWEVECYKPRQPMPDRLLSFYALQQGQSVQSPNGNYVLCLQSSGNLELTKGQELVWSSDSKGRGVGPYHCRLHDNGNAVIYDHRSVPIWASGVQSKDVKGPFQMIVQNDGMCVISGATGSPTWKSYRSLNQLSTDIPVPANRFLYSPNNLFFFFLQPDGNLVIKQSLDFFNLDAAPALWESGTAGKGTAPYQLIMQSDGNLVIYDSRQSPTWASNTWHNGRGEYKVELDNNGELKIIESNGSIRWSVRANSSGSNKYRTVSDSLVSRCELEQGHYLQSSGGSFYLRMQSDGNLVATSANGWSATETIWSSKTNGHGVGPYRSKLEENGNLIIYDSTNAVIWMSGVYEKGTIGPYRLTVESNGNLVIYDSNNKPTWSTFTDDYILHSMFPNEFFSSGDYLMSPDRKFYFSLLHDGNLVLYKSGDFNPNYIIWQSGTAGKGYAPYRVTMKSDGNLVLSDSRNSIIWSSNTATQTLNQLRVTDSGQLLIVNPSGSPVWSQGNANPTSRMPDALWHIGTLQQNQYLQSQNENFYMYLHDNGNLVMYASKDFNISKAIWESNTINKGVGPYICKLQSDGNVVIYDSRSTAIWATDTDRKGPVPCRFVMQDDGNAVLYDANYRPLWASQTYGYSLSCLTSDHAPSLKASKGLISENHLFSLFLQSNGNLELCATSSRDPLWTSNSSGKGAGPYELVMQSDGNLVIYGSQGPTWASGTYGKGVAPYKLAMQEDGNLVVYDSRGSATWASNTSFQDKVIFDLKSVATPEPGYVPVTRHNWNPLLQCGAMWKSDELNRGSIDDIWQFSIPTTGYYYVMGSCCGGGNVSIDGQQIMTLDNAMSTVAYSSVKLSKGLHRIRVKAASKDGQAGVAVVIHARKDNITAGTTQGKADDAQAKADTFKASYEQGMSRAAEIRASIQPQLSTEVEVSFEGVSATKVSKSSVDLSGRLEVGVSEERTLASASGSTGGENANASYSAQSSVKVAVGASMEGSIKISKDEVEITGSLEAQMRESVNASASGTAFAGNDEARAGVEGGASAEAGCGGSAKVEGTIGVTDGDVSAKGSAGAFYGYDASANATGSATVGIGGLNVTYSAEGSGDVKMGYYAEAEGELQYGRHGIVAGVGAKAGEGIDANAEGSASADWGVVKTTVEAGIGGSVGLVAAFDAGGQCTFKDGKLKIGLKGELALIVGIEFDLSVELDFSGAVDSINSFINGGAAKTLDVLIDFASEQARNVAKAFNKTQQGLEDAARAVEQTAKAAWQSCEDALKEVANFTKQAVQEAIQAIKTAEEALRNAGKVIVNGIVDMGRKVVDVAASVGKAIADTARNCINSAVHQISNVVSTAKQAISQGVTVAANAVKDALRRICFW